MLTLLPCLGTFLMFALILCVSVCVFYTFDLNLTWELLGAARCCAVQLWVLFSFCCCLDDGDDDVIWMWMWLKIANWRLVWFASLRFGFAFGYSNSFACTRPGTHATHSFIHSFRHTFIRSFSQLIHQLNFLRIQSVTDSDMFMMSVQFKFFKYSFAFFFGLFFGSCWPFCWLFFWGVLVSFSFMNLFLFCGSSCGN